MIFPTNIKEDKEGYLSASYGSYDPMLVESIKALKTLIDEQKKLIESHNNRIFALENQIQASLK